MPTIRWLDHVNIRTANLEALVRFYEDVIGLKSGTRPPLGFPGAWMYAGERAVIHLVGVAEQPQPQGALRLEHFALAGSRLSELKGRLKERAVPYDESRQPGTGNVIINLKDPDGNRLHIDFAGSEAG
ncbi:MAG TPA: VOC family protein [Polyangiaceae bacterium]|nr:VOC family protein [Polyangiaceae bacterium]